MDNPDALKAYASIATAVLGLIIVVKLLSYPIIGVVLRRYHTKMKLLADAAIDDYLVAFPTSRHECRGDNPVQGLGKFIGFGIQMFILVAGLFMLVYLFVGCL